MANCDVDVIRRVEKMCRMNAAVDTEMTRNERLTVLHLNMLEATGTVRDHRLISELVDQVFARVTGRLKGEHPDFAYVTRGE